MEKLCEMLEDVKMTVLSGVLLALSLILRLNDISLLFDPAWISIVISGLPILYSAIKKLIKNKGISKISSTLLISTAMIASVIIGDVFAAGEVAFIMAIGELLEHKTTQRARRGLENLIALKPEKGRIITPDGEKSVLADEICVGDIVRILPGEHIPVDGVIVSGETSVDQSVMTGESLPVDKTVGESVFCGTVNRFGSIDIRATQVGTSSSLSKLITMVKEAENKKAPMQRIADKWASVLVPVAMLIAILAYVFTGDIVRAVTILVVFCPCALVLATPTAIMAAIGQATKHGVVIKSGEALEKLGKVNAFAFDKTGTLTTGKLSVSEVIPIGDMTEKDVIFYAASAESKSEHPLAKAIVSYASDYGVSVSDTQKFSMSAGRGITADIDGKCVMCGNEKYMRENGIAISDELLKKPSEEGKAIVIVSVDSICVGVITLSDVLRKESAEVVSQLEGLGTECVLLTGDNEKTADFFAKQSGITNVKSSLLPEQKVAEIEKMKNGGKIVCMIGDGVNDAPALKTADVGVAMGGEGCDIAALAADVALMSDDITKISYLKKLSNATSKTIKIGISLSLFINFTAIVLSLLKLLTPTTGALVHNAGAIIVVLFAAMLYDRKI